MKWLLFFIFAALFSCNSKKADNDTQTKTDSAQFLKKNTTIYIDSFPAEELFGSDTGYFKNLAPEKIDSSPESNTSLVKFIKSNLDRTGIILLNKFGLAHSCRISPDTLYRTDTFLCGKTSIIQRANVWHTKLLALQIDGYTIKAVNDGKEKIEYPLSFYPGSFMHFIFKKKEYYYLSAHILNSFGTSMGNVCWHLIYNVKAHRLNLFTSCRFEELLFGDVNGDDNLDFVDFSNEGMCTTVPTSADFSIKLYSDNGNGTLVLQKDKNGNPYFIEGGCGADFISVDSLNIKKAHWPVKLKL